MTSIPRTSGIYKITCTPTGKIYIGSANNLSQRISTHKYTLRKGNHINKYLQNAWNKYGEDKFRFEVLELVLSSFLLEREQYYLDKLKPFRERGFNIYRVAGSPQGQVVTDEARKKMSEAQYRWLNSLSPEEREALRQSRSERFRKMRERNAGKPRKPHSPESKIKAREYAMLRVRAVYTVISPDGVEMVIRDLRNFSEERGLPYKRMLRISSSKGGECEGWRCKRGGELEPGQQYRLGGCTANETTQTEPHD